MQKGCYYWGLKCAFSALGGHGTLNVSDRQEPPHCSHRCAAERAVTNRVMLRNLPKWTGTDSASLGQLRRTWACPRAPSPTARQPAGSREERGKNGEGTKQRFPQGLRATPLQSTPHAGAALLCSRVRAVPDNFLAPVLCCWAVFPHP